MNFNPRHTNGEPITTQAAQKWLTGQAFPAIDKIATLAAWLNVPLQWLRFGFVDDRPTASPRWKTSKVKATAPPPSADELKLLEVLRVMPKQRRELVLGIVQQFVLGQEI